jgi:hypothetical protein
MVLITPVLVMSSGLMAEFDPGDTVSNSIDVVLMVNISDT